MTKAEIVQAVYSRLGGFSKKESADLVDLVFETMKETLGRGEKIKISGFGNFVLRDKRQRQGRNPQTGEPDSYLAYDVVRRCYEKGLLMFNPVGFGGATVKIAPPLVITEEAAREGVVVLREALAEAVVARQSTLQEAVSR